jgi:hypothetical protein
MPDHKPKPTSFKLHIGKLADRFGQPSYEGIAESEGITYQEVKKWHELYRAGTLQRQLVVEEFCEQAFKRLRPRLLTVEDLLRKRSESSTDKPH